MATNQYPDAGLPLFYEKYEKHYAVGVHQNVLGTSSAMLHIREVYMMALMETSKTLFTSGPETRTAAFLTAAAQLRTSPAGRMPCSMTRRWPNGASKSRRNRKTRSTLRS